MLVNLIIKTGRFGFDKVFGSSVFFLHSKDILMETFLGKEILACFSAWLLIYFGSFLKTC